MHRRPPRPPLFPYPPLFRSRDAVTAVRLLVKAGDFEGARRLGDSLLRAAPRGVAGPAGVAVLLGRPALAARLVAPEDPETERSEEHTSELQSRLHLVCRLLL